MANDGYARASCDPSVGYHETITEFRRFACEPPARPDMLSSGTGHRQGCGNTVRVWQMPRAITNVISASAGPKTCSHEQRK
jgi:hypothetical protein